MMKSKDIFFGYYYFICRRKLKQKNKKCEGGMFCPPSMPIKDETKVRVIFKKEKSEK